MNLLKFGHGEYIVSVGYYGEKPAVFIEPTDEPGVSGEIVPADVKFERKVLVEGSTVMTFPTMAQARLIANSIVGRELRPTGRTDERCS